MISLLDKFLISSSKGNMNLFEMELIKYHPTRKRAMFLRKKKDQFHLVNYPIVQMDEFQRIQSKMLMNWLQKVH
jgi:hypothetical protein